MSPKVGPSLNKSKQLGAHPTVLLAKTLRVPSWVTPVTIAIRSLIELGRRMHVSDVRETQDVGEQSPMAVALNEVSVEPKLSPLTVADDGPDTGLLLGSLHSGIRQSNPRPDQ